MNNFRLPLLHAAQLAGIRTIAAGGADYPWDQRLGKAGMQFVPLPISQRGLDPLADLALLHRMVCLFRRERPQLVHAFTIKPVIYGTIAAWLARVPLRVVTITGLGHAFISGHGALRWVVERLYRFALSRADAVIFQNEDDRTLFITRGLVCREKTRLVAGSGVDIARFAPTPLPLAENGPVVLMVARLLREKGIVEYIHAARIVRRRQPGIRFLIVGGVDTRNPSGISADQFAELNRDHVVEWIGEVEDIVPVIQDADLVVLPSWREGTPRSLLEAAAMGRPIVTTDTPGCREVVSDGVNGRLVPVADAAALAETILELTNNPKMLARMGMASRDMVERQFDQNIIIEQTLNLYCELNRN